MLIVWLLNYVIAE